MAVPDRFVAEILEGELFTSPRPASPHARAASALGSAIFSRFDGPPGSPELPGGWWILDEPELHLGEDVLVPDIAGWRRERMPELPDVVGFTLAPDWVCEVISPTTARIDRGRKMKIYAREGVPRLWIVDPLAQTVECYRFDDGSWVVDQVHEGNSQLCAAPFDVVEIDVARCWAMR